jgi:flagellar biosynthetic protein FlhB
MGPKMLDGMATAMLTAFDDAGTPGQIMTARGLESLAMSTLSTIALALAPVALVCAIAAVVANVGQVGLRPSAEALKPQPRRINPLQGAKNVFGPRMFFEGGKSVLKVVVVGVIVAMSLMPKMTQLAATVGTNPAQLGSELAGMVFEFRSHSLPAEVKGAQRRRMMQQARARMMAAVPEADVVVTNPTHFAVALKYDGTRPAPVVVAKGQDLIALQIKRIAAEHDVPVVENKPLARSLHRTVEIGQLIPEELFHAVAQVLAHVYRVAGTARRKAVAR